MADTRKEYEGKKVFAMGESLGAQVLLNQVFAEQAKGEDGSLADGYVFTGPVINLLPEMLPPAPVIYVIKFLSKFLPRLRMPGSDFFSTFDLAFGDKRWALAGRADPIIQEAAQIPPRLGMIASILNSIKNVNQFMENITVPFIVFVGEHEQRVDVSAVRRLGKVPQSDDKSLEVVKGAYHQLFQDLPEVTQSVCEGVAKWVLARS